MPGEKMSPAARETKHGKRMIEESLRFWTNNISAGPGKIIPKHAWPSGVVRIQGDESHGIVSTIPKPFHSLLGVGAVVESVLIENDMALHLGRRIKKYMCLTQ